MAAGVEGLRNVVGMVKILCSVKSPIPSRRAPRGLHVHEIVYLLIERADRRGVRREIGKNWGQMLSRLTQAFLRVHGP